MKLAFDFENHDLVAKTLKQILRGNESTIGEAQVVLTESVGKVLHYMQNTDSKVLQISFGQYHPMTHLIEDYPQRLRVVELEKVPNSLAVILKSIQELVT